jgi:hypothetical protein
MMWRRWTRVRIRLSHVEITYRDGAVDCVPWAEVGSYQSNLSFSSAVRARCPRLPRCVRVPWRIGWQTIERLRVRAVERALRAGSYKRFWPGQTPVTPARIAGLTFVSTLAAVGVIAAVLGLRSLRHGAKPIVDAGILLDGAGLVLAIFGVVLPLILVAVDRFGKHRPRALALRTDARGIAYHMEDGRLVFRPWAELLARKRRWFEGPRACVMRCGCTPRERGWDALVRAAERVYVPQARPRMAVATRFRQPVACFGCMAFAFMVMFCLIALSDYWYPRQLPDGRTPHSPGETLWLGAGLSLFVAALGPVMACRELGWRSVWRTWGRTSIRRSQA